MTGARMAASPRSPSLRGPGPLPRYRSGCFHRPSVISSGPPGLESLFPAVPRGNLKLREVANLATVTQQWSGLLRMGADQLSSAPQDSSLCQLTLDPELGVPLTPQPREGGGPACLVRVLRMPQGDEKPPFRGMREL